MKITRVSVPDESEPKYVVTEDPVSYWKFAQAVRERTRFIFDKQTSSYLDTVRQGCRGRIKSIKKDQFFWRARAAFRWREVPISDDDFTEEPAPCEPAEMTPTNEHAREGGRANPPGIAYLYLATKPETALAECRPWLNKEISVGLFKAERDLSVVVCDQQPDEADIFLELEGKLTEEQQRNRLWADIGSAFSVPVDRNDAAVSYIPTQILAELFKSEGADGVAYRSRLSKGTNVALFDVKAATLVRQYLYKASKISYEFKAEPNYEIWMKNEKVTRVVSRFESTST